MKTRPYIICTPSYCVSAGVRVMHNLCHELNGLGFDAKILLTSNISPAGQPLLNPNLRTPIVNHLIPEHWDQIVEESIFIMADGIPGNPFGAKRLVRYILGKEGGPGPGDEYRVYYSRSFASDQTRDNPTLYLMPIDLSLFNYNNAPERSQDMTWLGKGAKFCKEMPPNVVPITYDWPPTKPELAAELRKTRYLYSWDPVSSTNVEAVLCGAIVIYKHLSYHDHVWTRADVERTELGTGGFAFDESPAEIERARRTIPEMMERAREHIANFRPRLLEFVATTQERFRE